jgi:hypothetical protein
LLFALGRPVAFVGLLLGFVLALALRTVIGVVVVLACCFFPLSYPLLLLPLDLIGTVFLRLWG